MKANDSLGEVLVVDDEPEIRLILRSVLEGAGYRVREAENGRTALAEVRRRCPDVILLDLGLPDVAGGQVLGSLRPYCSAPVLVISVFTEELSKVAALDAGADDYMIKPFGTRELLARVRAMQRRVRLPAPPPELRYGPIALDMANRRISCHDRRIRLTQKEYALVQLLIVHADQVLTHRQILREVWGAHADKQIHYLRIYMTRLRHKLGDDVAEAYFETESGVGYRFVSEPAGAASPTGA